MDPQARRHQTVLAYGITVCTDTLQHLIRTHAPPDLIGDAATDLFLLAIQWPGPGDANQAVGSARLWLNDYRNELEEAFNRVPPDPHERNDPCDDQSSGSWWP